jgi:catechol 2,3-dioxygenase-like lactoylglutathione lyase family enzyme
MNRIHVALSVANLPLSIAFYKMLFAVEPEHIEPDHAKFTPSDLKVNFTLNAGSEPNGHQVLSHLGIEVETPATLERALQRIQSSGLPVDEERNVECCYARQDKFWVRDPDGNRWEFFLVHESALPHSDEANRAKDRAGACSSGGCC